MLLQLFSLFHPHSDYHLIIEYIVFIPTSYFFVLCCYFSLMNVIFYTFIVIVILSLLLLLLLLMFPFHFFLFFSLWKSMHINHFIQKETFRRHYCEIAKQSFVWFWLASGLMFSNKLHRWILLVMPPPGVVLRSSTRQRRRSWRRRRRIRGTPFKGYGAWLLVKDTERESASNEVQWYYHGDGGMEEGGGRHSISSRYVEVGVIFRRCELESWVNKAIHFRLWGQDLFL